MKRLFFVFRCHKYLTSFISCFALCFLIVVDSGWMELHPLSSTWRRGKTHLRRSAWSASVLVLVLNELMYDCSSETPRGWRHLETPPSNHHHHHSLSQKKKKNSSAEFCSSVFTHIRHLVAAVGTAWSNSIQRGPIIRRNIRGQCR